MSSTTRTIDGEPVTTKLAMRMEDSLQAFAVRAACFIGELDIPYTEEFDGHDFSATHIVAYVGSEPAGAVRVRWLQSFAMPERLAVIQRFRGHGIGALLLERCRTLAEGRGCSRLFVQALPSAAGYFERLGWEKVVDEASEAGASDGAAAGDPAATVAFSRPVAPGPAVAGADGAPSGAAVPRGPEASPRDRD